MTAVTGGVKAPRPQFTTTLTPPRDRVLLRQYDAPESTDFGLVLPQGVAERPLRGTVIAVGDGPIDASGRQHPIPIEVGDEVLIPKYGGTEIDDGDEGPTISIMSSEILCVVRPS